MREIARQPPNSSRSVSVPVFEDLEPLVRELSAAREMAAITQTPTPELLTVLDAALAGAARGADRLAAATRAIPRAGVVAYLGLLLKAYPNAGTQDAATFGEFMRDDVMSLEPSIGAVEMACRRWRRKSKFLPAIAEMMLEVRVAKEELDGAADFVRRLPTIREAVARELRG